MLKENSIDRFLKSWFQRYMRDTHPEFLPARGKPSLAYQSNVDVYRMKVSSTHSAWIWFGMDKKASSSVVAELGWTQSGMKLADLPGWDLKVSAAPPDGYVSLSDSRIGGNDSAGSWRGLELSEPSDVIKARAWEACKKTQIYERSYEMHKKQIQKRSPSATEQAMYEENRASYAGFMRLWSWTMENLDLTEDDLDSITLDVRRQCRYLLDKYGFAFLNNRMGRASAKS